jgi:hypothetical protein
VHLAGAKEMNQNAFCKNCHRIPSQCCCTPSGWKYLTDAEIKEIVGSYADGVGGYTRELFDKIEAKVREKNEREPKENN